MSDMENVIKAYECCKNSFDRICEKCPYEKDCCHDGIPMFVIKTMVELLKEQKDLGTELTNAVELIHKKNERIEKLLKEQEAIVLCKDCKHREESVSPSWEAWCNRLHCGCDLDWFCADGERR